MSKPIRHPQLGNLSITRAKLLFIETMLADSSLTMRELRAGGVIINSVDTAAGYGATSLDFIARALGSNESGIAKAVSGLERKGYFRVERGTYQHGGRGHANRYYPNWLKVQSVKPITDAAAAMAGAVKLTTPIPINLTGIKAPETTIETLSERSAKPCQSDQTSLLTVSTDVLPAHVSAPAPESAGAIDLSPIGFSDLSDQEVMGQLEQIQRWLRERPDRDLTADQIDDVGLLRDECYALWESRDLGDPIGGMAGRLADELDALLHEYENGLRDYVAEHDRKIAEKQFRTIDAELNATGGKDGRATTDGTTVATPTDDVVVALDPWPTGQKQFGPWLGARRNELGIQLRELADVLKIKASDLYDIETGRVGLGIAMQRKAVTYLKERAA